jgi:hypothetical protein
MVLQPSLLPLTFAQSNYAIMYALKSTGFMLCADNFIIEWRRFNALLTVATKYRKRQVKMLNVYLQQQRKKQTIIRLSRTTRCCLAS